MTDTTPSGALDAAATPAGTFGSTRGSGLARGKRQTSAAAPTAAAPAKSDYKPTALEVITPKSEYRNPFASPEPENAPVEEPAKIEAPEAPVATIAPEAAAPAEEPAEEPIEEPADERHEINILPPTEAHRPSVSWESSAPSPEARSHESRPTFRPERRDEQPSDRRSEPAEGERREHGNGQRREGGDGRFESRGRRHDPYRGQPRDPRDYPEEQSERPQPFRAPAAPAPKGFFAWLKSLFAAPAPAAPAAREHGGDRDHGGQRRRRHRGGRGRGEGGPQGHPGGERSERSFGEGGEQRGEYRGGEGGGNRRRRHRGGRDRDRGPRSEGQQGGGAI